jgi:hypothetical protein
MSAPSVPTCKDGLHPRYPASMDGWHPVGANMLRWMAPLLPAAWMDCTHVTCVNVRCLNRQRTVTQVIGVQSILAVVLMGWDAHIPK